MTKPKNRPGMGFYFAILLLLLGGYYIFFGSLRTPRVTYAQVEDFFRREQVASFYVKDGDQLYLTLRDGSAYRNDLGSV